MNQKQELHRTTPTNNSEKSVKQQRTTLSR